VITNAEPLTPWQRQAIREGLCDQVRETYGMAEIAAAGSECVQGALHEWPEVGWIETLDDREDRPAADGETGRLVCTGLLNSDMPLIRYALGDRGRLETRAEPCGCGRRLPVFSALEGRSNDMLVAPDGRRVFWLNPVFYGTAIREAQIVQAEADALTVRLVPAPGFDARTKTAIEGRLIARMGNVRVKFEEHSAIPRGENGKFRPIVCDLPAAGRSAAGGAIA
jgi:phenylacetate-CoA ligase